MLPTRGRPAVGPPVRAGGGRSQRPTGRDQGPWAEASASSATDHSPLAALATGKRMQRPSRRNGIADPPPPARWASEQRQGPLVGEEVLPPTPRRARPRPHSTAGFERLAAHVDEGAHLHDRAAPGPRDHPHRLLPNGAGEAGGIHDHGLGPLPLRELHDRGRRPPGPDGMAVRPGEPPHELEPARRRVDRDHRARAQQRRLDGVRLPPARRLADSRRRGSPGAHPAGPLARAAARSEAVGDGDDLRRSNADVRGQPLPGRANTAVPWRR
jgi:hypothetical protein